MNVARTAEGDGVSCELSAHAPCLLVTNMRICGVTNGHCLLLSLRLNCRNSEDENSYVQGCRWIPSLTLHNDSWSKSSEDTSSLPEDDAAAEAGGGDWRPQPCLLPGMLLRSQFLLTLLVSSVCGSVLSVSLS